VTLRLASLDVVDAIDLANAVAAGPDFPANVGFEVVWTAAGPFVPLRHEAHGFRGEFRKAMATVAWTGSTGDSHYVSAPAATSKVVFAVVGRERNGMFLF